MSGHRDPKMVMRYDHHRENLDQNAVNHLNYDEDGKGIRSLMYGGFWGNHCVDPSSLIKFGEGQKMRFSFLRFSQLLSILIVTIFAGAGHSIAQTANQTFAQNGQANAQTKTQEARPPTPLPPEAPNKRDVVFSRHAYSYDRLCSW